VPLKLEKTEKNEKLVIERSLYVKRHSFTLDKTHCTGCGICVEVCPREAIEIKKVQKSKEGRAQRPIIDIDEQKCHYCGICSSICPFGAVEIYVDGKPRVPVNETDSFPKLTRKIEIDTKKCKVGCVDCEEACPLELIKVTVRSPEGEEVRDIESRLDEEDLEVDVDIDVEHCPCCRVCEFKCPEGAIRVQKIFQGVLKINQEKCPEGCRDCVDVCPIPEVLSISEDGKVSVNELFCIYCGVCKVVCPQEGALELRRTRIRHEPVRSAAWNKALEKLTSTKEMSKELQTRAIEKTRESVEKRLRWREE
jgi:4Fe-4S ferredoxin